MVAKGVGVFDGKHLRCDTLGGRCRRRGNDDGGRAVAGRWWQGDHETHLTKEHGYQRHPNPERYLHGRGRFPGQRQKTVWGEGILSLLWVSKLSRKKRS